MREVLNDPRETTIVCRPAGSAVRINGVNPRATPLRLTNAPGGFDATSIRPVPAGAAGATGWPFARDAEAGAGFDAIGAAATGAAAAGPRARSGDHVGA